MKKFLFLIIFAVMSVGFSGKVNAQINRSGNGQRTDDGILIAYPNPTKDILVLRSKDNALKIKSVTFFSILGAPVAEYFINNTSVELRLDKLRPGKYLMRYTLDDETQKITQIIKQ